MNKTGRKLLKEIRKIKNYYKHHSSWGFGVDNEFLNALEYVVILKNRSIFYIQPGSYKIPDFRFSDVLYVRKTNYNNYNYEFVDNLLGGYNTTIMEARSTITKLMKKYKTTAIIKTTLDDDWE